MFTVLFTIMLGRLLERWPRVAVVRLGAPAFTLALIVGLAWAIPARQPHADKVLLDIEAVIATLYLGFIARSWWRGLGRRTVPRAVVRPRS